MIAYIWEWESMVLITFFPVICRGMQSRTTRTRDKYNLDLESIKDLRHLLKMLESI
jgi:hypothetical protein